MRLSPRLVFLYSAIFQWRMLILEEGWPKVADCPLIIFGNYPPQMVPIARSKYWCFTRVWRIDSGPSLYNPGWPYRFGDLFTWWSTKLHCLLQKYVAAPRIVARRAVPQNGVLGNASALLSLLSTLGGGEEVESPRDIEGCGSKKPQRWATTRYK